MSQGLVEQLRELFVDVDPLKWIRLIVIIGGYILIRNLVQRDLAKRKMAAQLRADDKKKLESNKKALLEEPGKETQDAATSTAAFGWGNKTRLRVRKQKEQLEKAVEELKRSQAENEDDDADIQDLLED